MEETTFLPFSTTAAAVSSQDDSIASIFILYPINNFRYSYNFHCSYSYNYHYGNSNVHIPA